MRQDLTPDESVTDLIDTAIAPTDGQWSELNQLVRMGGASLSLIGFIKAMVHQSMNEMIQCDDNDTQMILRKRAEFNALRKLLAQIIAGLAIGDQPKEEEIEDDTQNFED